MREETRTHLDETVRRATIPQVCHRKRATTLDLADAHGKLCDRSLARTLVGGVKGGGVYVNWGDTRDEIEEIAKRDAESEEVPELGDGVCRPAGGRGLRAG